MHTTVPFQIVGQVPELSYTLSGIFLDVPVFSQFPVEEDFHISTSSVNWNGTLPRIILNFDVLVMGLSYVAKKTAWCLAKENSFKNPKTFCGVEMFSSFEDAITSARRELQKEIDLLTSFLRCMERTVRS